MLLLPAVKAQPLPPGVWPLAVAMRGDTPGHCCSTLAAQLLPVALALCPSPLEQPLVVLAVRLLSLLAPALPPGVLSWCLRGSPPSLPVVVCPFQVAPVLPQVVVL